MSAAAALSRAILARCLRLKPFDLAAWETCCTNRLVSPRMGGSGTDEDEGRFRLGMQQQTNSNSNVGWVPTTGRVLTAMRVLTDRWVLANLRRTST